MIFVISSILAVIVHAANSIDLSACLTQTSEINNLDGGQSNKLLMSHSEQLEMISDRQRAFYHINELTVCQTIDGSAIEGF